MVAYHAGLCGTTECPVITWDIRDDPSVVAAIVRAIEGPE